MRIKNKPQTKVNVKGLCLSIVFFATAYVVSEQLLAQEDALATQQNIEYMESKGDEQIEHSGGDPESIEKKVDKHATFPGGYPALVGHIDRTVKYPKDLREDLEGIVHVQFKVNADGSVSDYKVIKSSDKVFNYAALAIQDNMPKWTPAEKDGKKVASVMTLPVKFKPNPSATIAPPPPPPPAPPVPVRDGK